MHADALGIGVGYLQSGILERLDARGHAELHEAVHFARLFLGQITGRIEVLDFAGDGAGKTAGVKMGDRPDTALAGQDIAPVRLEPYAQRRHDAKPGDDDTALLQAFSLG